MRNFTLKIIVFFFAFPAFAQVEDLNETTVSSDIRFKQSSGDNNLELAMNPFSPTSSFELPKGFGIKYRRFNSETTAFRIGANISFANYVSISQQEDSNSGQLELKDKVNRLGITLRPGFEKHLLSSARLSPYFGGELILQWNTSTETSERQVGGATPVIEESVSKNGNFSDGFTFGLGALAGVDFYVAKKLYLGIELNYGLTYFSASNETFTDFDGTVDINNRGSVLRIAPQAFGSFRVGYLF